MNSLFLILFVFLPEKNKVGSDVCDICKFVVQYLDATLQANATEVRNTFPLGNNIHSPISYFKRTLLWNVLTNLLTPFDCTWSSGCYRESSWRSLQSSAWCEAAVWLSGWAVWTNHHQPFGQWVEPRCCVWSTWSLLKCIW